VSLKLLTWRLEVIVVGGLAAACRDGRALNEARQRECISMPGYSKKTATVNGRRYAQRNLGDQEIWYCPAPIEE